jgi:hypothetical protein
MTSSLVSSSLSQQAGQRAAIINQGLEHSADFGRAHQGNGFAIDFLDCHSLPALPVHRNLIRTRSIVEPDPSLLTQFGVSCCN